MQQLNLFDDLEMKPVDDVQAHPDTSLNGFYYERKSDRFVSFALGYRHYEISPTECEFPKEWQKWIMKDRAI